MGLKCKIAGHKWNYEYHEADPGCDRTCKRCGKKQYTNGMYSGIVADPFQFHDYEPERGLPNFENPPPPPAPLFKKEKTDTMSSVRQQGYYWVKWCGKWMVGHYLTNSFNQTGWAISGINRADNSLITDDQLSEINDTRIAAPDERGVTTSA